MDKLLYWEPCDKRWSETLPYSGKVIERLSTRELKSDNPEIDKMWFTGSAGPKPGDPFRIHLNILMKDGARGDFEVSDEQVESLDIPEAIEFLKTKNT